MDTQASPLERRAGTQPCEGCKEIILAGGCFWGTQEYLAGIPGVRGTSVGYANGRRPSPTYEAVCTGNTGYAEAVHVVYDPAVLSLPFLLQLFFESIDPTSVNRQGGDTGEQYRTGIYYLENEDRKMAKAELETLSLNINKPVAVELEPLHNYYLAEEYHQDYLKKNPGGYCHISPALFQKAKSAKEGGDDGLER